MASTTNIILGTAAAILIWTCIGLAVARTVLSDRALVWPLAPALGWAVHSAAMLPLFMLIGFTRTTVAIVVAASLAGGAFALWRQGAANRSASLGVPVWAWGGAALLALGPAAAILPKFADDAVLLAAPIFDHAKVAMIDEMARLGLPPGNPFFGEEGQPSRVADHYLLHFSAAELALLLGLSGWEADAALTAFTAFASLMLMMGLATWISGRPIAALFVLIVCAAGSLRPLLAFIPGINSAILPATGFAGWLFQITWAPQHIASAACVVLAMLLLSELTHRESGILLATFALVVVAGFESSTWVGGVTFAVAGLWIGAVLLAHAAPRERLPFLGRCAIAAICAAALAAPMLYDQALAMAARGGGWPVALQTYAVLGEIFPPMVRQFLDVPAYWLILLPIELPAIYLAGVVTMVRLIKSADSDPARQRIVRVFVHLAGASLVAAWLMVSTGSGNNELGARAMLPGMLMLSVFASAGVAQWIKANRRLAAAAFAAMALGLPEGIGILARNVTGTPEPAARAFAATPEMWATVRRHAGPADRVGNNPLFLREMTWQPANISWALLSNRRSCYAGFDLVQQFVPLPRQRLREIDALFIRAFSGEAWPDDLRVLATQYACRVIVVTELDGAWARDPFATSEHWRLVEVERQRLAHLCRQGGCGGRCTEWARARVTIARRWRRPPMAFARPAENA